RCAEVWHHRHRVPSQDRNTKVQMREAARLHSLIPLRVIALLFLGISGSPLRAAEVECVHQYDGTPFPDDYGRKHWPSGFRPVAGMCEQGYIHGKIAKGDYEKVRTFLTKNQNIMSLFYLSSLGGDVDESILIGRLFRKYL